MLALSIRYKHQLYVGALSPESTESSVKEFYSKFGTVEAFKSVRHMDKYRRLSHAFVSFALKEQVGPFYFKLPSNIFFMSKIFFYYREEVFVR